MQVCYISAFPGLLIFTMNMLGTFMPGNIHLNIIAVFPLLIPTFFGLFLLKKMPYQPVVEVWDTEDE